MATIGDPISIPGGLRRRVSIRTLDGLGQPAVGAVIEVIAGGVLAGAITVGSSNKPHVIEVADPTSDIQLVTTFQGLVDHQMLSQNQASIEIVFTSFAPKTAAPVLAKAECADGTTRKPCVDCPGGVRICG